MWMGIPPPRPRMFCAWVYSGVFSVAAFETEQLDIGDLFSDAFVFNFPLYQRPYRWGPENAEALLTCELAGTLATAWDL